MVAKFTAKRVRRSKKPFEDGEGIRAGLSGVKTSVCQEFSVEFTDGSGQQSDDMSGVV